MRQARGDVRGIDRRSDVYGLGAALYDLLIGQPPFVGDSTVRIILQVLSADPPPLRLRDATIPEALEVIVLKCLNKEPHQRYASAAELAADLDRLVQRQRVQARRLSVWEQLYWKGRRNRPLAAAMMALSVLLLGFVGYGIRTAVQNARREAVSLQRAALAQRLGQAVQDLEWLVRTAQLLPLHDIGPDRALVRARMAEIRDEMRSFGALAAGLDHYALGRGHLALQEWEPALRELQAAEAAGIDEPGLHYALGRALGERYSAALSDARKSGDRSFFERRKREIDAQHLPAVLRHLQRSRQGQTTSASYIEALLDFYQQRYAAALLHAQFAARSTPWLYEALRLQGDVHLAQALSARDQGDTDGAERSFGQAVRAYEQAADIGRSDASLHEAIAEAWIRQEEMDMYRGRDPRPNLDRALAAADRALAADPQGSHGYTKKAFGYMFFGRYLANHGGNIQEIETAIRSQISFAEVAIAQHASDFHAHEAAGVGYQTLLEHYIEKKISMTLAPSAIGLLAEKSKQYLRQAIRLEPMSPWLNNHLGMALATSAYAKKSRGDSPVGELQQAILSFKEAIRIDDRYLLAYNNISAWLLELADWQESHAVDPLTVLSEAIDYAEMAIKMNPNNPLGYGNCGQAYARRAAWLRKIEGDGRLAAGKAVAHFRTLLELDSGMTAAYRDLASALELQAWHQHRRGQDASAATEQARQYAKRCQTAEPGNADCAAVLSATVAAASNRAQPAGPR